MLRVQGDTDARTDTHRDPLQVERGREHVAQPRCDPQREGAVGAGDEQARARRRRGGPEGPPRRALAALKRVVSCCRRVSPAWWPRLSLTSLNRSRSSSSSAPGLARRRAAPQRLVEGAAVPEPGELVGEGQPPAVGQRVRLAEGDDEPAEGEHDGARAEGDRQGVQRVVVVVDQQRQGGERRDDRESRGWPRWAARRRRSGALPCRERHHQCREDPHGVDGAAGLVGPGRGREQVDGVRDREEGQPCGHAPQPEGRSPRNTASSAVTTSSSSTSSRGYANVVTTAATLPPVTARTGPKHAAATPAPPGRRRPRPATGSAGRRRQLADDEVQRDERARVEAQPEPVSRRRERFRVLSTDEHVQTMLPTRTE